MQVAADDCLWWPGGSADNYVGWQQNRDFQRAADRAHTRLDVRRAREDACDLASAVHRRDRTSIRRPGEARHKQDVPVAIEGCGGQLQAPTDDSRRATGSVHDYRGWLGTETEPDLGSVVRRHGHIVDGPSQKVAACVDGAVRVR